MVEMAAVREVAALKGWVRRGGSCVVRLGRSSYFVTLLVKDLDLRGMKCGFCWV